MLISDNLRATMNQVADARLDGSMDWMNPGVCKSAKEEEVELSGLVSDFSTRMLKQMASA